MFESLVLPEIDIEAEWFDRIHYHTCGYTHLLDLCLSRPYMHVIQYSPNLKESKEESSRLPFYRRVQETHDSPPVHNNDTVRVTDDDGL